MYKTITAFCILLFIFSCCASPYTKEKFIEPGPHYMKTPDKEGEQAVGNVVGMAEGGATGFLAGGIAGILAYKAITGSVDTGMIPLVSVFAIVFTIPGAIIGWNIPYGKIGFPAEDDKKREIEKREDEHLRNLFKDKNPQ
jgi:hypothetical protein